MDEQLRIILIIIISVSIFGLIVFVFVKNYIRNKINQLIKEEEDKTNKLVALADLNDNVKRTFCAVFDHSETNHTCPDVVREEDKPKTAETLHQA